MTKEVSHSEWVVVERNREREKEREGEREREKNLIIGECSVSPLVVQSVYVHWCVSSSSTQTSDWSVRTQ